MTTNNILNKNNKSNLIIFCIVFLIATAGLISAINTIYLHINSAKIIEENKNLSLNQKLFAVEKQLDIITNENSNLRDEIEKLNDKIDELTPSLDLKN